MTDTDAILDNARYLRHVRPIDPEEIHEYVEDRPHPAVVRETLREHAFELGLRERADGTFVPVEPGRVDPAFDGVERLPEEYGRRLEELLVERYGPGWPDGETGDRIRARIDRLTEAYFADADVEYDAETALAYAVYHLPDYYAAIQYVLDELAREGRLGRRLRVLDVGAGTGGPALGLHDYLPADSLVAYHAVEPSAAADVLAHLVGATRPGFDVTVHRETAEAFEADGEYDLLVFANVVSELAEPVDVVDRYLDALADDGTLLAIAPAEKRTATRLRAVERELLERRPDATVFAPTVRVWPDEEPTDRGWTFVRRPELEPPAFQTRLDRGERGDGGEPSERGDGGEPGERGGEDEPGARPAEGDREDAADGFDPGEGRYEKSVVQYAYLLLRTDGRRAVQYEPDPEREAKMAEMETHVTERIDLVALKLSSDLADDGNPLYKVSDGSEAVDHYAVLTRESTLNEALRRAPYGSLLRFENVLVLWNDDEGAYNLVVDGEAVVERIE